MNTEITDKGNNGWVCYDADCALCVRWAARCRGLLERNGFTLMPLQSPAARAALGPGGEDLLAEMRVITPRGTVFGGADAIVYLAKVIRCGRIFFALACLPGVKPLLRWIYRRIARHRACGMGTGDACRNRARVFESFIGWLPLPVLTAAALASGRHFPSWAWMWNLCFALYAGCKWLTFWNAKVSGAAPGFGRAAGYLLAWPGMDAAAFFDRNSAPEKILRREWLFAGAKIFFGATLIWGAARMAFSIDPMLSGWTGMIGLIFALHFGLFHLLSLAWRKAGICARPLMRASLLACSLGEFWGCRWNTAFNDLANQLLFRRVRRVAGWRNATMTVFLASGLIHELVISVPARGGYGFPTLYFLLQGAGVLFEHSRFARRRCGIERGRSGRFFTLMMAGGLVFWLFHPPFVLNVMIPFLKTIRAL